MYACTMDVVKGLASAAAKLAGFGRADSAGSASFASGAAPSAAAGAASGGAGTGLVDPASSLSDDDESDADFYAAANVPFPDDTEDDEYAPADLPS